MRILVSIIVPVYNAEKYLECCLNSLIKQTYSPIEIILIDDGSTDSSSKICDLYGENNAEVIVIHKKNEGVSIARNLGLKVAKGEYIAFCDSDDYMKPDAINILVGNIQCFNADISCCGYSRLIKENEILPVDNSKSCIVLKGSEMFAAVICDPICLGYLWNKLFRRSILLKEKAIHFREDISILEDEIFVLEYLERSTSFCITKIPLYVYRENMEGAVRQKLSDRSLTSIWGREEILKIIERSSRDDCLVSKAWNQLVKAYSINYKKLLTTSLPNKLFWLEKVVSGSKLQYRRFMLDNTWGIKERAYYFLLWLAIKANTKNDCE